MILSALTNGLVSGTGQITTMSGVFGGCIISTDSTNNATVEIKEDDSNGTTIFAMISKEPIAVFAPFEIGNTRLYYSITGTNATAILFEMKKHWM